VSAAEASEASRDRLELTLTPARAIGSEPCTRTPSSSLSAGTVPPRNPASLRWTRWLSGRTVTIVYSTPFRSSILRAACEGWEIDIQ
jgi:hypothetical protein